MPTALYSANFLTSKTEPTKNKGKKSICLKFPRSEDNKALNKRNGEAIVLYKSGNIIRQAADITEYRMERLKMTYIFL